VGHFLQLAVWGLLGTLEGLVVEEVVEGER